MNTPTSCSEFTGRYINVLWNLYCSIEKVTKYRNNIYIYIGHFRLLLQRRTKRQWVLHLFLQCIDLIYHSICIIRYTITAHTRFTLVSLSTLSKGEGRLSQRRNCTILMFGCLNTPFFDSWCLQYNQYWQLIVSLLSNLCRFLIDFRARSIWFNAHWQLFTSIPKL